MTVATKLCLSIIQLTAIAALRSLGYWIEKFIDHIHANFKSIARIGW